MIKKENLEKIADTFWGKTEKKRSPKNKVFFFIIFIFISLLVTSVYLFLSSPVKLKPKARILTFDLGREIIKMSYNFKDTDLKIKKYTIDLGDLNLNGFKELELSVRKEKFKGNVSLKVELENSLREKGYCYISGIKNRWQILNIDLSEFEKINDWSNIKRLSFIIEEWNVQEKADTIYIDEIRFKRERSQSTISN